jgi:hypothetical protein
MADLWVVLTVLAFFGLCIGLIKGCDLIIGSDETEELVEPASDADELAAEVGVR